MSNAKRLRLGLPKGTLQETTGKLLALAGYQVSFSGRTYYPPIDDPEIECVLIRAQEMARYVEQGVMDCGITGLDWVLENKAKVKELADLVAPWPNYRPIRWVLAVKDDSRFKSVKDLSGKRIATEGVGPHQGLPETERREGRGRVLVGRDRGEAADPGRRDRRHHRDGFGPARERPPRDRRGDGHDAALHREPRVARRRVEAQEDGELRHAAARRDQRRLARRAHDEPAPREPRRDREAAARARDAHDLRARRRALGRDQHRRRGEARARAASRVSPRPARRASSSTRSTRSSSERAAAADAAASCSCSSPSLRGSAPRGGGS